MREERAYPLSVAAVADFKAVLPIQQRHGGRIGWGCKLQAVEGVCAGFDLGLLRDYRAPARPYLWSHREARRWEHQELRRALAAVPHTRRPLNRP